MVVLNLFSKLRLKWCLAGALWSLQLITQNLLSFFGQLIINQIIAKEFCAYFFAESDAGGACLEVVLIKKSVLYVANNNKGAIRGLFDPHTNLFQKQMKLTKLVPVLSFHSVVCFINPCAYFTRSDRYLERFLHLKQLKSKL